VQRVLFFLSLCLLSNGCKEYELIHNLSEVQANDLQAELLESDIDSYKTKEEDNKWMLSVDSSYRKRSIKVLASSPIVKSLNLLGIEANTNIFQSKEDRKLQIEKGIALSLQDTLLRMSWVKDARVHLKLDEVVDLLDENKKGTASVLIVTSDSTKLTKENLASLIAKASGIDNENVAVWIVQESFKKSNAQTNYHKNLNTLNKVNTEKRSFFKSLNYRFIVLVTLSLMLFSIFLVMLFSKKNNLPTSLKNLTK
jgi:type III secretory pathway lipoprotein EscJ